jgi:hypothetical protein
MTAPRQFFALRRHSVATYVGHRVGMESEIDGFVPVVGFGAEEDGEIVEAVVVFAVDEGGEVKEVDVTLAVEGIEEVELLF